MLSSQVKRRKPFERKKEKQAGILLSDQSLEFELQEMLSQHRGEKPQSEGTGRDLTRQKQIMYDVFRNSV